MRVPVTPRTNAPAGELGYERPVDVTAGTRMLADVVGKYAQYAQERQNQRQMFDVQKRLVDETVNIQQDFKQRSEAKLLGAPNFTQEVATAYDTRHAQMVKDLKDQGYSDEAVNEFATRLGTIRAQYVAKAIDFQDKSNFAKGLDDSDQMVTSLSQYVGANPNDVGSALDEFKSSLTHLGLDPIEQNTIYLKGKGTILKAAQQGFAIAHPDVVLGLFGLPNEITVNSPTNLPDGQQFSLPNYIQKLGPAEGTGKNPRSSAVGFGQFTDDTWVDTYKKVYGDTKETRAQILAKKSDTATATKLTEKLTSDNIQGLQNDPKGAKPINDATVYLAHFLGLGGALATLNAHADATMQSLIGKPNGPARNDPIRSNPEVFAKVKTAADMIAWAQNKMGVADATSNTQMVMGYPVVDNPDRSQWGNRADGTPKGSGWLGPLKRPDGSISTEISVGVNIDGKETEIPLMVPGLKKSELDYLMNNDPSSPDFQKNMPKGLLQKAENHAKEQISQGLSPFKQDAGGLTPEDIASLRESYDRATPSTAPALFQNGEKIPFEQFQAMAHAPGTADAVAARRVEMTQGVRFDAQGKTGVPVLDLATGEDRLQMLNTARTIFNEREADAMQAQRKAHDDWYNGFLNKLQDGTLGQTDLDNAYKSGQITDFDERKKAQAIIDDKNDKTKYLRLFGTMLASGQKFNPYDNEAQKAVDAGFEKAITLKENGQAPDPFVTALVAWRKTGILPTQGGVMLRGALIGTDPKQVAAAASVASNMLKENPNAFASVTGGDEIGKAAATYAHYVDDLGMDATSAANKIALMNSPEGQARAKLSENDPQRQHLIDIINGKGRQAGIDINKVVNDAIFGEKGWGSTLTFGLFDPQRGQFNPTQAAEAKSTYTELALEHFDKYHDAGAAQAYAQKQMSRFYGVEGTRLMKYPPTKAYPEIMGSRDYIYKQASEDVSKFVGFKVPPEDVFLQPTANGSTANAFRNGKAPPYDLYYVTHDNGQTNYHYVPGKVFVADINKAKQDAAKQANEQRQQMLRNRAAMSSVIRAKGGG